MIWEPIIWNTVSDNFNFTENLFSGQINLVVLSIVIGQLVIFVGIVGILRRNNSILLVLLCFELCLLGLNLSIIFLGLLLNQPLCLVVSMLLLVLSAIETAIGLSLIFNFYNVNSTTSLKVLSHLRF